MNEKMKRKLNISKGSLRNLSAEGVSKRVFYVLVILSALMIGAYYLIAYRRPWIENPDFNAPLLTGVLILFLVLLLLAALAVMIWAAIAGVGNRCREDRVCNGIPVAKISYGVGGFTVLLLLLSFLLGSSSSLWINGKRYQEIFWLKSADMFIDTSLILMLLALTGVMAGYLWTLTRKK